MSVPEREIASEKIAEKVIHSPWFRKARTIGCYLPTPAEVDTRLIIARAWRMKKRIFVPVLKKNQRMIFQEIGPETDLLLNRFGIYEPKNGDCIPARDLDIVITPVVAFDDSNNRIGMGGGYYDRAFSFLQHRKFAFRPRLIGVAFACQKVEQIAPNPWDIRLFATFTEVATAERR